MYKCEILADSINPQGDRLVTYKITFPRFILPEFNTHRLFSRNSASSRAVPFRKKVQELLDDPFIPHAWQQTHKGMQGSKYFENNEANQYLTKVWLDGRNAAITHAKRLAKGCFTDDELFVYDTHGDLITDDSVVGVTKQLCNRMLEPYMWHTVIVTATHYDNFFNLRCPQYEYPNNKGVYYKSFLDMQKKHVTWGIEYLVTDRLKVNNSQADIHIQFIAEMMWDARNKSTPKQLKADEWHVPFGDDMDENLIINLKDSKGNNLVSDATYNLRKKYPRQLQYEINEVKLKVATARCARISYETLGANPVRDYKKDIILHDKLAESGHWSPFEHCAKAMSNLEYASHFSGKLDDEYLVDPHELSDTDLTELISNDEFGWCRNFRGFIQYRDLVDKVSLC